MAATRVWSSPYPFHCPLWTRSLRVTHELRGRQPQWLCSEFVPFLLLFDCQEAFHCCLVVTCINRINMISIQCHRVGEWWSGKPEFENVSDPAGVYIPFNHPCTALNRQASGRGHTTGSRILKILLHHNLSMPLTFGDFLWFFYVIWPFSTSFVLLYNFWSFYSVLDVIII